MLIKIRWYLHKLRCWSIRKLDAVDRESCLHFAERCLVAKEGETVKSWSMLSDAEFPSGAVLLGDGIGIIGGINRGTIHVAPWCKYVRIHGLTSLTEKEQ